MATLPDGIWKGRAASSAAAILWIGVLLFGGCAGRVYRVADLPAELLAPPVDNVEAIGLSRLTQYSVGNELIDQGDVLEVTIVTDYGGLPALTMPVRVGEGGCGDIPLIGRVELAGLELEGAEQRIAAEGVHRGVFRNPHVTVEMKRRRTNRITVIGAVEEPGVYELRRGACSLLAALVTAGGLSEEAGADVEIRRVALQQHEPGLIQPDGRRVAGEAPGKLASYESTTSSAPRVFHVNLAAAAQAGDAANRLADGDVVVVPKRAQVPIRVMGLVSKPGEFELPASQNLYMLDALALAGGRTMQVADKVLLIRRVPGRAEPVVVEISVKEAKRNGKDNMRLAPGDIVSVEQTPTTLMMDFLSQILHVGASIPVF